MLLIATAIAMGAALLAISLVAMWEVIVGSTPRDNQRWYDSQFDTIVQDL